MPAVGLIKRIAMAYLPIENYGIISYLNTIAFIGLNGSIDFMCFPNFDFPFPEFLNKKAAMHKPLL